MSKFYPYRKKSFYGLSLKRIISVLFTTFNGCILIPLFERFSLNLLELCQLLFDQVKCYRLLTNIRFQYNRPVYWVYKPNLSHIFNYERIKL